jgi:type IV pilus assembly protein PilC
MTVYEYRARNRMGELVTGTYESSDMSDVVHMLRNKGLYPVFIEECREKRSDTLMKVSFRKVTYKDIAVFCRQFATMINAGMPIPDILDVLGRQTENPRLKTGIESLYHGVQKGKSLSNAIILLYIITIPYKDKQRPHDSLRRNRCFSCNFGTVFVLAVKVSTTN